MDAIQQAEGEKIKAKQELVQEFRVLQGALIAYIRKVRQSSVYAGQSAACLALERWVAKGDRVLQLLQELKL